MTVTADWVRNKLEEKSVSIEDALLDIDSKIQKSMENVVPPAKGGYTYTWNYNYWLPKQYISLVSVIINELNSRGFDVEFKQELNDIEFKARLIIRVEMVL